MKSAADFSTREAARLERQQMAALMEGNTVEGDSVMEDEGDGLLSKIRFSWRKEDEAILARIDAAANAEFDEVFTDAVDVIDRFYESLRIPEQDPHTGVARTDGHGRIVWKRAANGEAIED